MSKSRMPFLRYELQINKPTFSLFSLLFFVGFGVLFFTILPAANAQDVTAPSAAPTQAPANSQSTQPANLQNNRQPTTTNPNTRQPATIQQPNTRTPATPTQSGTRQSTTTPANANQPRTANQANPTNAAQGTNDPNNPLTNNPNDTNRNREQNDKTPEEIARDQIRRRVFGYSIFNGSDVTFEPNPRLSAPASYIIGSQDVLNVLVYGFSDASYPRLSVNPQGNILIPRVGPISVTGLTLSEAENKIRDRLSQYISGLKNSAYGPQNTYIRVTIDQVRTIRVNMVGEIARPGSYNVSSLTTAYNALYQSGGPTEIGSFRNIQILRKNKAIRTIDLYAYLLTGQTKDDINLQDDDVIFIPPYKTRIDINGEVKKPGLFEVLPGETLGTVLGYAGGFTEVAYRSIIRLIRLTDRDRRMIDVDGTQVASLELKDADVINVERILDRYNNIVFIRGAVYRPDQYPLDENPTLKKLVERAEGVTSDAFTGRISLRRLKPDLSVEQFSFDLSKILSGETPDFKLQKQDDIQVYSIAEMREQRMVRILGEVLNPAKDANNGYFPWLEGMTIEDLLVSAGGLRQNASIYNVEVVRPSRDSNTQKIDSKVAETFTVAVDRDLKVTGAGAKFLLQPLDEVYVRVAPNFQTPQFIEIQGQVVNPGPYGIQDRDERISDVLKRAGGVSPFAFVPGASLIRRVKLSNVELQLRQQALAEISDDSQRSAVVADAVVADKPEQVGIDLSSILKHPHSEEDLIVQEGDIISIPKLQQTVRIGGEVFYPITTRYTDNLGFLEYVSRAGGFTSRSVKRRAFVVYANGDIKRTKRFLFFNSYPRVEPGAEISVPLRTKSDISTQQILTSLTQSISALTSIGTILLLIRNLK